MSPVSAESESSPKASSCLAKLNGGKNLSVLCLSVCYKKKLSNVLLNVPLSVY